MASRDKPRNVAQAERQIDKFLRGDSHQIDLSDLGLIELPERLREASAIGRLLLVDNQLKDLPDWLEEFHHLTFLDLYRNRFRVVPPCVLKLGSLRILDLGRNPGVYPSDSLAVLKNLTYVGIEGLRLRELPSFLRHLPMLDSISAGENEITALPSWIDELTQLKRLQLSANRLSSLPQSLRALKNLVFLDLRVNPTLNLPPEIVSPNNPGKVLDYYFRTSAAGAAQPLNEFKLILVGRGGVGKTTLVHRLVSDLYKEFKRTPGIKITDWLCDIDQEKIRAHVWDFGGQEIMHGTHRFFMTERAVYLVLLSGREGSEDQDAEYWLSLVRSFAGDVPIIVLLHRWSDYPFEVNRELLRQKYGKNIVFIETDSATGHGIVALREAVGTLAGSLFGLRAAWPVQWRAIKDELPSKGKNWLTFDDFRRFCSEHGVSDPQDQEALADSLHALGLMLSFRKEETLRHFGVLNPQWVTKGIYEMLNAPKLREAGGKFTIQSFAEVLPPRLYPKELHPYLLALMRRFQLCHPLDDKGQRYLIPELLTKEEPRLEAEFPPDRCLGFTYRYDVVLPEGLLPRFIVETYVHREPKLVWRTGVVLERANCRALVRGDIQGRKVSIRVSGTGNGRRELLGIIREHFERIHNTYEKLPVTELVPIPEHADAQVKHELLLKYERSGRSTIAVEVGEELRDFSVTELLDGIDLPGAPRAASPASMKASARGRLPLFISYSHKDVVFMDQLRGALVPYERTGDLQVWADPLIEPGDEWEESINTNLDRAAIIVLLLSNDFIRSYYCIEKELARALERRESGGAAIIPVVVRASRFDKLPIGRIQAIQPDGKPIDEHEKPDRAWYEVTKELDRVIARLNRQKN
jgi:internalin A